MGNAGVLDPLSQNYGPLGWLGGEVQFASLWADNGNPEIEPRTPRRAVRPVGTEYGAPARRSARICPENRLWPIRELVPTNAITRTDAVVPLQTPDQRSGGPLHCG
jgi:hypothetical protein